MPGCAGQQQVDQLDRHHRRDDHLAARGAADRVDDVVGVHVLQQVAAHARAERPAEVLLRIAHRQHDDRRVDALGADAREQPVAVDRHHAQVHDREVRALVAQQPHRLVGIAGGPDDLDARARLEQLRQAAAAQAVVVDQDDPDGFGHGRSSSWRVLPREMELDPRAGRARAEHEVAAEPAGALVHDRDAVVARFVRVAAPGYAAMPTPSSSITIT